LISPIISPGLPQITPKMSNQPYFTYDLRSNTPTSSKHTRKKTPFSYIFKRKSSKGKSKKQKIDDSSHSLSIQGTLIPSTPIIHVPHDRIRSPRESSEIIGYTPLTSTSYFSLPQRSNRSSPVDMSNTQQPCSSRNTIPWLPPATQTTSESLPVTNIPNENDEQINQCSLTQDSRTRTRYSLRRQNTPSYIEESYRKQYKPRTREK